MLYEDERYRHTGLGGRGRKETVKDEGFYEVLTFTAIDLEGVKICRKDV